MHLPVRSSTNLAAVLAAGLVLAQGLPAEGQTGPRWRYLHGGENYGIAFVSSTQGIITRDGGGALYSDDGGATWTASDITDSVRGQLRNLHVLDASNVWTVGAGGVVLKTGDRGQVWSLLNQGDLILNKLDPPRVANLYDIWMFDEFIGFACGERGALSKTTNGGATWTDVPLPTSFFDPDEAAAPDPDWKIANPGDLYRIHFFNADDGIITADHGRVLTTNDGGQSWGSGGFHYCSHDPAGDLELWSAAFDGQHGWIVGGNGHNNGHSFYTSNGGQGWSYVPWVVPKDTPAFDGFMFDDPFEPLFGEPKGWPTFYGVAAVGNGTAVAVSYASNVYEFSPDSSGIPGVHRCSSGNPLNTTGDPTWLQRAPDSYTGSGMSPGRPPLRSVTALDSSQLWLCGTFGVIQRTETGPANWTDVGTTHRFRHAHFAFADEDVGVIAGQGYKIVRTEDGGLTWALVHIGGANDNTYAMRRVVLSRKSNSSLGLAHGDNGVLRLTQDQGETWTAQTPPASPLIGMAMAGETDIVYASGATGTVWRSDLGSLGSGGTVVWQSRDLPSSDAVTDFAFVDDSVGYAATEGMTLWHTTDGGVQWSEISIVSPPGTQNIKAIATYGDGSKAVAVGTGALVLVRNSARFEVVDLSALAGVSILNDVAIQQSGSNLRIVIAGNNGLILNFEGTSLASALDPLNWTAPKSQSSDPMLALSFVGIDRGYSLGPASTLVEFR